LTSGSDGAAGRRAVLLNKLTTKATKAADQIDIVAPRLYQLTLVRCPSKPGPNVDVATQTSSAAALAWGPVYFSMVDGRIHSLSMQRQILSAAPWGNVLILSRGTLLIRLSSKSVSRSKQQAAIRSVDTSFLSPRLTAMSMESGQA
jgi:hypothetical protein